jgi:predicted Zn-dependent protease
MGNAGRSWARAVLHPLWVGLALLLLALPARAASQERVEYWRNNYEVLSTEHHPRVAQARRIFQQVLGAAGSVGGVTPRLLVIKDKSLRVIALPDGWVILSAGALERCYRDTQRGDDRLAFILGHEIAHQLKDDFWHMRFFQALDAYEKRAEAPKDTLAAVRALAAQTNETRAKELAADEHGIIYAAMAGFDPRAIIDEKRGIDFFAEWNEALDPRRLDKGTSTHPGARQRAQAVRARLASVFEQAGMHQEAIASFGLFASHFPSREVSHNLAVSHYHLALNAYGQWKTAEPDFTLLPRLDPDTRAADWTSRSDEPPEERFREHIGLAIRHARAAVEQDTGYAPAYLTAAAALLLNDQPYEALGLLGQARRRFGDSPEWHNALGVAQQIAGDRHKAAAHFHDALAAEPRHGAARYNLGRLAQLQGDAPAARQYWQACIDQAADSHWAGKARRALGQGPSPAAVQPLDRAPRHEIRPGRYLDELPGTPKPVSRALVPAGESPYLVLRYTDGQVLVARDERLLLVGQTRPGPQPNASGIAPGDPADRLRAIHGEPQQVLASGDMEIWRYGQAGISYRIKDGKVDSWLVFMPEG